jgi:hypothetical protein
VAEQVFNPYFTTKRPWKREWVWFVVKRVLVPVSVGTIAFETERRQWHIGADYASRFIWERRPAVGEMCAGCGMTSGHMLVFERGTARQAGYEGLHVAHDGAQAVAQFHRQPAMPRFSM